jgi:uncharacterized membrane protein HdeD (DUF308 family)
MIQTLAKNWWLLALSGVIEATISVIYFIMYDAGQDALPFGGWNAEVVLLCRLSVAAGVCAIAAGIWRSTTGVSWLLVLNGVALGAYGLLPLLWRGPLGFRLFAFLIAVRAMSFGVFALSVARTMRHEARGTDRRLFGFAGTASVGFALAFLALANGWIQLERRPFHPSFFLWLCLFFGFDAICMVALALRLRSLGPSQSGSGEVLSPLGNPKHAH